MAHSWLHAKSSAKKFGGVPEDYVAIHDFFDSSKAHIADPRHRMLLHNSFGIFIAEKIFGHTITNSIGREVPVRLIGEQHVKEDFGFIPSVEQCLENMPIETWMSAGASALSRDPKLRRLKPERGTLSSSAVQTTMPPEENP